MSDQAWEKQSDRYPIWEAKKKGDSIIGKVTGIRLNVGFHGILDIETPKGNVSIWLSSVLALRIRNVKEQQTIKLVYLGRTLKTEKGMAHDWELYIAK